METFKEVEQSSQVGSESEERMIREFERIIKNYNFLKNGYLSKNLFIVFDPTKEKITLEGIPKKVSVGDREVTRVYWVIYVPDKKVFEELKDRYKIQPRRFVDNVSELPSRMEVKIRLGGRREMEAKSRAEQYPRVATRMHTLEYGSEASYLGIKKDLQKIKRPTLLGESESGVLLPGSYLGIKLGYEQRKYNIKTFHGSIRGDLYNLEELKLSNPPSILKDLQKNFGYGITVGYSVLKAAVSGGHSKELKVFLDPFLGFLNVGYSFYRGAFLGFDLGLAQIGYVAKRGLTFSFYNPLTSLGITAITNAVRAYVNIVGEEMKKRKGFFGKIKGFFVGTFKALFGYNLWKSVSDSYKKKGFFAAVKTFFGYWITQAKVVLTSFYENNLRRPFLGFMGLVSFLRRQLFKRDKLIESYKECLSRNNKKLSLRDLEDLEDIYFESISHALNGDKYRALERVEELLSLDLPSYVKGRLYAQYNWLRKECGFPLGFSDVAREEEQMLERWKELDKKGWDNLNEEERREYVFLFSYFETKVSYIVGVTSFNRNRDLYSTLIFPSVKDREKFNEVIALLNRGFRYVKDYYLKEVDNPLEKYIIVSDMNTFISIASSGRISGLEDLSQLSFQEDYLKSVRRDAYMYVLENGIYNIHRRAQLAYELLSDQDGRERVIDILKRDRELAMAVNSIIVENVKMSLASRSPFMWVPDLELLVYMIEKGVAYGIDRELLEEILKNKESITNLEKADAEKIEKYLTNSRELA